MIEESTRQTGKLRKVVYTCVTAGYSVVPVRHQSGWDYVCFCEEQIDVVGWRMQPIPADALVLEHDLRPHDKAKTTKRIKLLPHRFLPDYDVSIWIDATLAFRPNVDLDALLDRFLASGKAFQVRAHPYRRCTYDEPLDECAIKATHSPGDVQVLRRDGDGLDLVTVLGWLGKDPYAINRDRSFRGLTPKILVEPLIVDDDGALAMDCKVLCFAGVPAIVRVDVDRFGWRRNAFYSADTR